MRKAGVQRQCGQRASVIGDAVNLASRIEGLTKTFGAEVMFSSQVKDSAGIDGAMVLGAVRVKGRSGLLVR